VLIGVHVGATVGLYVCMSDEAVCLVQCGKTAYRTWIRFRIVGRMGPGMRQVLGFGDQSMG